MQTSKSLLIRYLPLCTLLLPLFINACAPLEQAELRAVAPSTATICPPQGPADDTELIATPEEINEELAGLKGLGSWKSGKPKDGDIFFLDAAGPNSVPLVMNPQVEYYIGFFQGRYRCHFTKWLSRSTLYLPTIQQHFAQKGLPPELAALAMIESGFSPVALSSAKANGLWQFIEETGRRYGLRVDPYVDERRNADKASAAAAAYLKKLYEEFGHWYLAVAAYNAGEGKIRKAIERYGTRDFWELADQPYLALETKRYVPQLIAAIIIMNDPARYGFGDNEYQFPEPLEYVELPGGVPLTAVAMSANCSADELQRINRELKKNHTPPGKQSYTLRVPQGTASLVAQNLPRLQRRMETEYATHTVQSGQKIAEICKQYDISTTTLLKANNLRNASLKPGQRLRIPQTIERYVFADSPRTGKSVAGQNAEPRSQGEHTAGQVALRPEGRKAKATAAEPAPQPAKPAVAAGTKESSKTAQVEPRKTKAAPATNAAAAKPAKEQLYVVQRGDNLWKIAKKFQVSADDIRRWNKLGSNELKPGERLRIREA
ncbi:MAG: hypothetical protein BWK76_07585 [Desulfobulbaceae bacterium A2]|nr:MAG: hypothetical protein BWK76_07585 [Desulfobulbaceae bacterium A2]